MGRNTGSDAAAVKERSVIQPRRLTVSAPSEADSWAAGVEVKLPEGLEQLEAVHPPAEFDEFDADGNPILEGLSPFTRSEGMRYATAILENAGVKKGDVVGLMINADDPEQCDAANMIIDAGYRSGVHVELAVPGHVGEEHMQALLESDATFIQLSSFTPPDAEPVEVDEATAWEQEALVAGSVSATSDEDGLAAWNAYSQAKNANEARWSIAMWPTRAWAKSVYPELEPDEAFRQLGKDIRYLARCSDEDDENTWREHIAALKRRADFLNGMQVEKLEISGGGTELEVDIARGADFLPCEWETKRGSTVCVNVPTEEIFTTPDPKKARGRIQATKPLVWIDPLTRESQVIEGVWARIEDGEIVEVGCKDPAQRELLDRIFTAELGTNRLGELGLVGQESRVVELGRTFNNTIIDENAGLHFGFGNSFDSITGGEGNRGKAHYDVSCGNDETVIYAVGKDGRKEKIMERGRWLI